MDMMENPNYYFDGSRYKSKYICTDCRKSFKRKILSDVTDDKNLDEKDARCPDCGKPTLWLGPKFRAPKTDNINAWKSIKALHDIGLLHFIGWANNYIDIPETTKGLKDLLKDLKTNYEWNIKKWTTSKYSADNKNQITYLAEAIKKIDKHLRIK